MSLVIIDTETGGLEPQHPTIQVAAMAVDADFREVAFLERKIIFVEALCTQEALSSNHYDKATWARDAVPLYSALQALDGFLRDHADVSRISKRGNAYRTCRLAGHNAASFDMPRLQQHFDAENMFFPGDFRVLDTLHLWRWLRHLDPSKPESGRLSDVAQHYGISAEGAHDALVDCRMVSRIAPLMIEDMRS